MLKITALSIIISLAGFVSKVSADDHANYLKDFKTDLCTSWPEGTREQPSLWAHCCIKHDLSYWVAGTKNDRHLGDLELKSCVTKAHSAFMGELMYQGVKAGRLSPIKGKWRWGWAWPKSRPKHKKLSAIELQHALATSYAQENVDPQLMQEFIDFRFPIQ